MQLAKTIAMVALALVLSWPALAQQSPARMNLQEISVSLQRAREKYEGLAAQQRDDPACVISGGKACDESLSDVVQVVGRLQSRAKAVMERDFPGSGLTPATGGMSLGQLVAVLQANELEVQLVLDKFAKRGD